MKEIFFRKYAVGIDQALNALGITVLGPSQIVLAQATLYSDAEQNNDILRVYSLANQVRDWLAAIMVPLTGHTMYLSECCVTREDHGFMQHGRAALNLEIGAHIDRVMLDARKDPGFDYFKALPTAWMKWCKVKKPVIKFQSKKRKPGEDGQPIYYNNKKLDVEGYRKMYPNKGMNEHELDSYFLALYGCHLHAFALKKQYETVKAEA